MTNGTTIQLSKEEREIIILPEKELLGLVRKIVPLARARDRQLREIIGWRDHHANVFAWLDGKKKTEHGQLNHLAFLRNPVYGKIRRGLERHYQIDTFHPCEYADMYFSGTIAQVLSQIPSERREESVAFEVGDIRFEDKYTHRAEVHLYRRK